MLIGYRIEATVDHMSQKFFIGRVATKGDFDHTGIRGRNQEHSQRAIHRAVPGDLARSQGKRGGFASCAAALFVFGEEMIEPLIAGQLTLAISAFGGVLVDPLFVQDSEVAADIAGQGIAAQIAFIDIGTARLDGEIDECGRLGAVGVQRAVVRC